MQLQLNLFFDGKVLLLEDGSNMKAKEMATYMFLLTTWRTVHVCTMHCVCIIIIQYNCVN